MHTDELLAHQLEGVAHNDDVGVVAHIAAGDTQMDDALGMGALQAVSIDVAHDVVADQLLAGSGLLIVDVILVGLQLGDLLVGDVQALALFGLGQCDPQPPPGAELLVVGEEKLHLVRGVAGGEGGNITIMRHK